MFVRILNSEMELATGCTEPGAVALTAAEAGAALRKTGSTRVEAVTVRASINIIKNAMSAGIPGTSYQGMDYAAAIGAVGGDPVHLLEVMNYVPREQMEEAGMKIAGTSPDGRLVEAVELPQHPYYVGVQYHPEFKSRPNKAHPLFREFIAAALKQK